MRESRLQSVFRLARESVTLWQRRQAPLLSAALAFYMVFSLSPLLLLSVSVAGILYGPEAATGQLLEQINDYLGEEAAAVIQEILATAESPSTNLLASLISTVVLLFGASLVFRQLKLVLNLIWDTVPEPDAGFSGILKMIKNYVLALLMALSIGLLLLLSLTFSALLAVLDSRILDQWPNLTGLFNWAEIVVLWLLPAVLFAIIFKVLPDVTLAWRDVWPGALVTTVLFAVGVRLVALYFRYATLSSLQGAAGTLIVILLWLYYSAQIFLMGAAFTCTFAGRRGSDNGATLPATAAEE